MCNSTYCDTIPRPQVVPSPHFLVYTSNQAGLRFQKTNGTFDPSSTETNFASYDSSSESDDSTYDNSTNNVYIDSNITYQTMVGWGGAFTDATGINVNTLPETLQETLLQSLFGKNGQEYNVGRVPIGGTDFSTRAYSYDDGTEDPQLHNFNLTYEDHNYKVVPLGVETRPLVLFFRYR